MISQYPSPNCGPRRHGGVPDMVVMHYTAMETAKDAIARLCDPCFEVSAHYVIAEDGAVTPLVAEMDRAWHAGAGAWGDVTDVNSHSIGIEIANGGPDSAAPEFPVSQLLAVETLLSSIFERWQIAPERVIAHSDMAPGRKIDPGPYFDWQRLATKGLSIWPEATDLPISWCRFAQDAQRFGYRAPEGDWRLVLEAFRLRFCPFANGPLSGRDMGLMAVLAQQWPHRNSGMENAG